MIKRYTTKRDGADVLLMIHADTWLGDAGTVRRFCAPRDFGYIYEIVDPSAPPRQVCAKLSRYGAALMGERVQLLDIVRREARACLRAEKRDELMYQAR